MIPPIHASRSKWEIVGRVVDGSELDEFKALYGTTLVCRFAHICGYPWAS